MIGEVKTLHPAFKFAVDAIMNGMRARGWDPAIGSGMRTNEQQDALYAQTRKPLKEVNALRTASGLPAISAAANTGKPVTYARGGLSNHNKRHSLLPHGSDAVDVAVGYAVDIVDRVYLWHPKNPKFWDDLGVLAKKYGCVWGGDWKGDKKDVAHVEMKLIDSAPRTSVVV
jgi:peptidoglycan LD-endopeptidase CwlK